MAFDGLGVLVVEDEPLIGFVLQDLIEEVGGHVVAHATTLSEAEQLADIEGFDLAILDINLNGEMSYPAARRLAAQKRPFFFVTGYAHLKVPEDLSEVPVLDKPYTRAAILRTAERVLDRPIPA
jgi:CheY-like chemotaxis protein